MTVTTQVPLMKPLAAYMFPSFVTRVDDRLPPCYLYDVAAVHVLVFLFVDDDSRCTSSKPFLVGDAVVTVDCTKSVHLRHGAAQQTRSGNSKVDLDV